VRDETVSEETVRDKFSSWYSPFMAQHIVQVTKDHTAAVFSGSDTIIEKVSGKSRWVSKNLLKKIVRPSTHPHKL